MRLLEKLKENSARYPDRTAVINNSIERDNYLTYRQLEQYSDRLAEYISNRVKALDTPIVVYGHKSPYMLVCFLACVKSGHPYYPIDISNPIERVHDIIEEANPPVIFVLETMDNPLNKDIEINLDEIKEICQQTCPNEGIYKLKGLKEEDVFYILFTSGSTGKPKGVEVTYSCLNNFLIWTNEIIYRYSIEHPFFINQAPFSFDLSVMDLYTNLYVGGTLVMLDKYTQMSFPDLIPALRQSNCSVWVSTPSFADMCLSDKKFNERLLPDLKLFFFCGEVLPNATALKLMERFPNADILNTFGPTETTVAVTEQYITKEIALRSEALPIGKPKPGTQIQIWDENNIPVRENVEGQIIIIGDTVSKGYYNNPDETARAFVNITVDDKTLKAYKTGDKGYFNSDGILYYSGRMDRQIKLNGYRIEIGDIEKNIMKLGNVSNVAVIPKYKDNKVKNLTAFITLYSEDNDERNVIKQIKKSLKELIPEYMVPKKMVILKVMPMNVNGKVDRKKLEELL